MSEADSGDILLFTGVTFSAKMTRKLTHSQYDHVAMVLTFCEDDDIYLLEATADGVHITNWKDMKRYMDRLYSKVVWRRLYAERDENFCEILETFIDAVQDKKYNISVAKLLKRFSIMPGSFKSDAPKVKIEKNRTFFCSELIAK